MEEELEAVESTWYPDAPYGPNPNDPGAVAGLPRGAVPSPTNPGFYIAWVGAPGGQMAEYEPGPQGGWRVRTVIQPYSVTGGGIRIGEQWAAALGGGGGGGGPTELTNAGGGGGENPLGPPVMPGLVPNPPPDVVSGELDPTEDTTAGRVPQPGDVGFIGPTLAQTMQDPDTAFTRYLATMPNAPSRGTGAREALENRGDYLKGLIPAFGYGISEDIQGGQGSDFAGAYGSMLGKMPSMSDVRSRAVGIREAIRSTAPDRLALIKAQMAAGLSPTRSEATYNELMAGNFEDPQKQFALVQGNLGSRVNPYWQPGLNRQLTKRFKEQEAVHPDQRFIDYALEHGLI